MSIHDIKHFLIIYRRSTGSLESLQEFEDLESAWAERLREEIAHREEPDVEVVLLGATSEGALRATHGRYFQSDEELAEDLRRAIAG